ncbi:hypothetical protein CAPTEDRAFT_204716 [Capitella teleta]|uniref:Uncharacterized protein n=1 Tax=Capitella teleta TaxID=283909 RepID=R7V8Y4_CAPTE|nr:hypothetical protein CAPTEDRAFT_204716 [Capitella teleta]|eukprot:ELU12170.1 hypothetical protein CAPTEDRAFT_204716 [Capitella teleta]
MRVNLLLALGILLGLMGASLLVAFGLWYVKPYMRIRDMQGGTCTTHVAFTTDELVTCTCAQDRSSSCLSQYPCLKVWVNITTEDGVQLDNVTVYDSYETFQFQHPTLQCSYHKCSRIAAQNLLAVEQFAESHAGIGDRFWCYFRPSDPSYAILDLVSAWTVVHCMLWPSVALVTGLVILVLHLNMDTAKSKRKNSHFNSLERPWLRHTDRNYVKVLSET